MEISFNPLLKTKKTQETKKNKPGKETFATHVQESVAPKDASSISNTQAVSMPESIYAIQDVQYIVVEKKEAKKQGEKLLEQLDLIRMGILTGQYSYDYLGEIQRLVAEKKADTLTTPQLKELLSDIETRAAVEIAKIEKLRRL